MKAINDLTTTEDKTGVLGKSYQGETDTEPTPKAEAKAANKLSRTESLNKFEQELEAHDNGNQAA